MYLTYDEFLGSKWGITIPEAEFDTLEYASELMLNEATFGRAREGNAAVKEAAAAQVAYLAMNGGAAGLLTADKVNSESIGQYSYSASGSASQGGGAGLGPFTRSILAGSGLLFRGVGRKC